MSSDAENPETTSPDIASTTIEQQLENREYSVSKFALGVRRFIIGLGKKVLIANVLGQLSNTFLSQLFVVNF